MASLEFGGFQASRYNYRIGQALAWPQAPDGLKPVLFGIGGDSGLKTAKLQTSMALRTANRLLLVVMFVAASRLGFGQALQEPICWRVEPADWLQYARHPIDLKDDRKEVRESASGQVGFFGFECLGASRFDWPLLGYSDLGPYLALALPGRKVTSSKPLRFELDPVECRTLPRLRILATYEVIGETRYQDRRCLMVQGKFQLRDAPQAELSGVSYRVAPSSCRTLQLYDPEEGVLRRTQWWLELNMEYVTPPEGKEPRFERHAGEQWRLARRLGEDDPTLHDEVDEAIQKGVRFLFDKQKEEGEWGSDERYPAGPTALVLLALLKSGVDKELPAVQNGFDYLRELPFTKTYSVSLLIMALEARVTPLEELEVSGTERQHELVRRGAQRILSEEDRKWMEAAVAWLRGNANSDGTWSYAENLRSGYSESHDHSNTQYAVLALHAASRCGLETEASFWKRIAQHCVQSQQRKGAALRWSQLHPRDSENREQYVEELRGSIRGWAYRDSTGKPEGASCTGSMTAAGLSNILISRWQLQRLNAFRGGLVRKLETALRDGMAWVVGHYSVRHSHGHGDYRWWYYYLYGLERVGMLSGQRWFGERDWYREGARMLLAAQRSDGSWGAEINTSFALLFLKRATVPIYTK